MIRKKDIQSGPSRETKTPKFANFHIRNQELETSILVVPSKEKVLNDKLKKLVLKSDILSECISEIIATFVLVFLSDCVNATLTLAHAGSVALATAPMGSALALIVALVISGGASGCHANPAVTLAFATVGKTKWNRVLPYTLAQYLGGFIAAAMVYAVYYDSIANFDGGLRQVPPDKNATAQIFATYPQPHVSIPAAFLDQVLGTGILLLAVAAIIDPKNLAIPKELYPLIIGFVLGAIIYALPYNCMAPLNPARDLSPRIFTYIIGYGPRVFSHRGYGYFMVPIMGPHIGAILGVWIYKLGIEIHWPEHKNMPIGQESVKTTDAEKLIEETEDTEPFDEGPTASLTNFNS